MDDEDKFVLASSSPRRRNLLDQIGLAYTVIEPGAAEESMKRDPRARVRENAVSKVYSIADKVEKGIVIGADTVVVKGETILEKPADDSEGTEMLRLLRAGSHSVFTGLAIYDKDSDRLEVLVEETIVNMRDFNEDELEDTFVLESPSERLVDMQYRV